MKHGAALVRLSGTRHGCGGLIEEFYVVVFNGLILPERYKTYREAIDCCETMLVKMNVDVA